jgi:hypothetical protein
MKYLTAAFIIVIVMSLVTASFVSPRDEKVKKMLFGILGPAILFCIFVIIRLVGGGVFTSLTGL